MAKEPEIASCLDKPVSKDKFWYTIPVRGWVVPPQEVRSLRIFVNESHVRDIVPGSEFRPDVARAFPGIHDAGMGGFDELVTVGGREGKLTIAVHALKTNGDEIPLGSRTVVNTRDAIFRAPRFFHLGLTSHCNLSCSMCPVHGNVHADRTKFTMIPPAVLSGALEGLQYYSRSIQRIFLADYGEPFLYPEIFEVIRRVSRICPRASIFINTNGTLLPGPVQKKIIDSALTDIAFSLDAATKKTYESIRAGSDFGLVVDTIRSLVKMKRATNRKFPRVITNFVLMRSNISELPGTFGLPPIWGWTISGRCMHSEYLPGMLHRFCTIRVTRMPS